MKVLFITSTHNSLSQQLLIKLTECRHEVAVALATSEEAMKTAVAKHRPDLIVVPMLTVPIPEAIWCHHRCLIVRLEIIDCFQVKVLIYRIRFPCNFTLHETPPRDQTREERIEVARCILEKCQRLGYNLKVEGEDTIVVYDAEWREVDRV